MIIKPMPVDQYEHCLRVEGTIVQSDDHLIHLYLGYKMNLVSVFRHKYSEDRRFTLDPTMGFTDEMKAWCDANDSDWTLIENYGLCWPLGFSSPDIAFAFRMRWL